MIVTGFIFGLCLSKCSDIHHAAGNVEVTGIIVCSCYCWWKVCGQEVSVVLAEDMYWFPTSFQQWAQDPTCRNEGMISSKNNFSKNVFLQSILYVSPSFSLFTELFSLSIGMAILVSSSTSWTKAFSFHVETVSEATQLPLRPLSSSERNN